MTRESILRPRRRERPHRRRLQLAAGGVFAAGQKIDAALYAAGIGEVPGLGMPEAEDSRGAMVSAALSALLHILIIGLIALIGYLAKEAAEQIIPVTILNEPIELPGSNKPAPLPVPKMLTAPVARAVPMAMEPANLAAIPAPRVEAPSLDPAVPKPIDISEVTSQPLATRAETTAIPSAADIAAVTPMEVSAADLTAPRLDLSGPSEAAARTPVDIGAVESFSGLANVDTSKYAGAVSAVPTASAIADTSGPYTASGVSADFQSVGVPGGDPNAVGTVDCLQSAYVHRYFDVIGERTKIGWQLPMDSDPDDTVKFKLAIDHAGVVVRLEVVESTNDEFGASAEKAIRDASPFPALTDNTRCLTGRTIYLTFDNPQK